MSSVLTEKLADLYLREFPSSERLYREACTVFPNGITHDSRYLQPFPVYIDHAKGSKKYDRDGHEIIDYWVGHGSLILGHSDPAMVAAVERQVSRGTHVGACHEAEIRWGQLVQKLVPSAERVRFTSSGTEATLMAVRVARIATGKQKVLKFAGHFHGWHDLLIPAADAPHGTGDYRMPGIPGGVMEDLIILPPNDLAAVAKAIDQHDPACLILEATGGHWGLVPMRGEFLKGVRELTARKGVVLIFDEVITGFRVHPGGSQGHYEVTPDLTTLAKILAGGLPGGALVGKAEFMAALEFENKFGQKMKHPGTYNGNPLSAAAGIAILEQVATGRPCDHANKIGRLLRRALNEVFERRGVNWIAYGEFSMVNVVPEYVGPRPDSDEFIPYGNAVEKLDRKINPKLSHAFRCALLLNGVDFFGWRGMASSAHTEEDVAKTADGVGRAVDLLRGEGLVE